MEAYVALHQADELQGIIGEIKVGKCFFCKILQVFSFFLSDIKN